MNKVNCRTCKHKIQKVESGMIYCAKTRPIRQVNMRMDECKPDWCPRKMKKRCVQNGKKLASKK